MLTLVVIVFLGLGFAFLGVQNTAVSTFNFLGYSWTLPMYIIVFGSLLVGFFISWVVSSVDTLGVWFSIRGKDSKIRESGQVVAKLQGKIRELELENAKLQGHVEAPQREVIVDKPVTENRLHSFFDRFRIKRDPAY